MTLRTLRRPSLLLCLGVTALGATACGGGDPVTLPTPTIQSFTAEPSTVVPGQTALLRYQVVGATSIRIDTDQGVNVLPETTSAQTMGSIVSPTLDQTTNFVLTALNSAGESKSTVTVTVDDGTTPVIDLFSAAPTTITEGESATLSWQTKNGVGARIEVAGNQIYGVPADQVDSGSYMITPTATETYTFVLVAADGSLPTQEVTVTVNPSVGGPVVQDFSASANPIDPGASTTLNWQVMDASMVSITDGAGQVVYGGTDLTGSQSVSPAATTTYTLVATDANSQTAMRMVTVTVNPPAGAQVTSFAANPTAVDPGNASTLSWQVQDAPGGITIEADGQNVHTDSALTGSFSVSPTQSTLYTLTAISPNGNATATALVTVNGTPGAAQVVSFTASPTTINAGASSALSWQVQDAPGGITIEAGGQTLHTNAAASGTFSVSPTQSTTYTLTAISPLGNATATVMVSVGVVTGPQVSSFTASPTQGTLGMTSDLSWMTTNATSVRILSGATELFNSTTMVASGSFAATLPADVNVFTIEALQAGQPTASQTLTVYGHAVPTINSFTVTPPAITGPTTVNVAWDVANVSGLTLTQDGVAVPGFVTVTSTTVAGPSQGSLPVMLTGPATFELVATSAAGSASQQVQVTLGMVLTEIEPNNTLAQAQPIPATGALTGALTPAGDLDIFRITVGAGGNVLAETSDGLGGCATDTVLILADLQGNTITFDEDGGALGGCSRIDPTVDGLAGDLPAGDYLIGVLHQDDVAGTGAYTLNVQVGTPACGNDIIEASTNEQCDFGDVLNGDGCSSTCQLEINPTVISGTGGTVSVNLATPDSIAVIQVDVTAGQSITATAADAGGTTCNVANTVMNLGDAQFNLLGQKADGGPTGTAGDCATIRFPEDLFATDLSAGSYFLVVFNGNATGGGTVQVTVGINSPVCGNGVVETNANEQCDNAGGAGQVPCNAMCQVATAGTVSLPSAAPQTLSNSIVSGAQIIQVNVTSPIYLRAETFSPTVGGCADDTVLELYDVNFAFLGGDDDGGTNACSLINENAFYARLDVGQYWLVVSEYNGGAITAYQVVLDALAITAASPVAQVEPNDTQATAQVTGLTGPGVLDVHGSIDPDGDDDVYSFTVPANTTVTLNARTYDTFGSPTMCSTSVDATDTRMFLEAEGTEATGPGTGELAYNDDVAATQYCSAISAQTLSGGTTGATFYLRVQGYNDTGLRQYFLNISLQ